MKTTKIMLATMLAAAFAPTLAAAPQPPEESHITMMEDAGGGAQGANVVHKRAITLTGLPGGAGVSFTVPMMNKVTKNAPYSAEVISESVQNLADGNQIVKKYSRNSYRDSAGRTRRENHNDKGELVSITIDDPVEGFSYTLNPRNKTANKVTRRSDVGPAVAVNEAARAQIEQLRKEGKLPAVERKEGAGEFIIKRVERSDGDAAKQGNDKVRIQFPGAPGELARQLVPVITNAMADTRWSRNATVKDLGTKDIEGVQAKGKMRSYEIPAGELGNRNPIVVTYETWHSPELQTIVYTKHSDPRSGERIYRMAGLKRDEPAAALFTVPSDYTVKDLTTPRKPAEEKK